MGLSPFEVRRTSLLDFSSLVVAWNAAQEADEPGLSGADRDDLLGMLERYD